MRGDPARRLEDPWRHDQPLALGVLMLAGLGGSSRVALELAAGLAARGHRVLALSGASAHARPDRLEGTLHRVVRAPTSPRAAEASWVEPLAEDLVHVVESERLQVLSVHYALGLAAAAVLARDRLAARGTRVAVCVTLHGTDVTRVDDPDDRAAMRATLAACDEVTTVSHWLAARAVQAFGISRPRVIANAIDTHLFRPLTRARSPGPVRLLHASNFRPIKRPLDAIEITRRVRAAGIDARLHMFGAGPLLAEARAHGRPLDADTGSIVVFPGMVAPRRLAVYMRGADAALVTSMSESFSLVALEAMASGILVIGSRSGGVEELLASDPALGDRLLVEAGDVDGMAGRLLALLHNPGLLEDTRRRCTALARGPRFAREDQLDAYADVFVRARAS